MRMNKIGGVFVALAAAGALATGCSSSSDCSDGGTCTSDAASNNDTASGLFGLSPGAYCYDVVSISGATDTCQIGVADLVGKSLPATYNTTDGSLKLGTDGSLGEGTIRNNMGTLTRDGMPTDPTMATCSWHQTDTTMVVLTAENEFTASITEVENMFATACTMPPTGGSCTSTWTWTFKINGAKTAPGCM